MRVSRFPPIDRDGQATVPSFAKALRTTRKPGGSGTDPRSIQEHDTRSGPRAQTSFALNNRKSVTHVLTAPAAHHRLLPIAYFPFFPSQIANALRQARLGWTQILIEQSQVLKCLNFHEQSSNQRLVERAEGQA
jgi:hypothetical protein